MALTADQVYDLIKQEEAQFTVPAPYVTIDVGTLDVATGTFTGLRSTSERDPEPLPHQPGQHPVNPPPRFIGQRWVSVTIDNTWHQTVTSTPAPKVALAPVLLRFAVANASAGWSVSAGGSTRSAPAGQDSLLVNVWDAKIVNWTLTAGGVSVSDSLRIQRPAGAPAGALGAFTIPVLPVTVVYAPPADSLGASTATYTTAHTLGTSVDLGFGNEQSSTVPVQATGFEGELQGFTGALNAEAALLKVAGAGSVATVFTAVAGQLGQVTSTHQHGISDGFEVTFTVIQSTTDTAGTNAAGGGPGEGDVLHFFKNVQMAWSYFDGDLRLCPLSWTNVFVTARGLRESPADTDLTEADAAALLALDPFVQDAAAAVLPSDRFTLVDRMEYGHGATIAKKLDFTRETKQQTTHKEVTTDTTTWDPGPILKALGLGGTTTTSLTLTNATGQDVSDTVTATANLASGADDYFVVNIWYDDLFGTFAFQPVQPAAEPRLAGTDAKPGQEVVLEAGGLRFRTVAGQDGSYQFRAPGIPAGQVTLTFD
jgi:hypothetical protein